MFSPLRFFFLLLFVFLEDHIKRSSCSGLFAVTGNAAAAAAGDGAEASDCDAAFLWLANVEWAVSRSVEGLV